MQLIYIKLQYLTDKNEFIEFSLNVASEFAECIPVGCVPSAAVAVCPDGECLPRGVSV